MEVEDATFLWQAVNECNAFASDLTFIPDFYAVADRLGYLYNAICEDEDLNRYRRMMDVYLLVPGQSYQWEKCEWCGCFFPDNVLLVLERDACGMLANEVVCQRCMIFRDLPLSGQVPTDKFWTTHRRSAIPMLRRELEQQINAQLLTSLADGWDDILNIP